MKILNWFRQKDDPQPIERKFHSPLSSFPEFLINNGNFDLSAFAAMEMYKQSMPLFNAIDKRGTAFSNIPLRLWDKKEKVFLEDSSVFELMSKPNADLTANEFLYQYSSFFDITGNAFLMATGRINMPPLELMTIRPDHVTFGFGSRFGFLKIPDVISITASNIGQISFKAEEDKVTGIIRFINKDQDKELWHTRQFNPMRSTANFWGMSKGAPLWLEIQQFLSGNRTNLSMLKRGTRISMAWVNNRAEELTEDQWNRLQEESQKYAGDMNAGGTPVLDGVDVKPTQQSNRDMEFNQMQETMEQRINKVYGIPLAKITASAMTLNNLETSQIQFYDDAVIPLANYLYAELTRFLLPRYKGMENVEFRLNEHDIAALKTRIIKNAAEQSDIGVNTDNEIRAMLGDEELDGGDVIYKPSNLLPVGKDIFTEDNLQRPTAEKFFKYMKKARDEGGKRTYSDSDIELILQEKYLIL